MSEPRYTCLGRELRAARQTRGWSLRQLADLLGVAHQRIILWEKGANQPRADYRKLLETLFYKKFDWTPDRVPPPKPSPSQERASEIRDERNELRRGVAA